MQIKLKNLNNQLSLSKKDAELVKMLLITLLKKTTLEAPEKHIESTHISETEVSLLLSEAIFKALNTFPDSFLDKTLTLSKEDDIKRILAILSIQQKAGTKEVKSGISPTLFAEKRKEDETLKQQKIIDKAELESQIISLIDKHRLKLVEDIGLSNGTDMITTERIVSANAHLEGQKSLLLPGTFGISFRTKEEAEKYLAYFHGAERPIVPFISEYTKGNQEQSMKCYMMLLEYSDIFSFPHRKKTTELDELATLIKKYDSIQIQGNYFFDILDKVSETGNLSLAELLHAVNYCFSSLLDLWSNHRFMERILEACRQCKISETQFLEGLIQLHKKRQEVLDVSTFLKMLFTLSVQQETLQNINQYLIDNHLLENNDLEQLIKKCGSIQIQHNFFFAILDKVRETKNLSPIDLLHAINYCFNSLQDAWNNPRFIERALDTCRQSKISETQFLEGLIQLHKERLEILEGDTFLKMLFTLSAQQETIKNISQYLIDNHLLEEKTILAIRPNIIPSENRWFFINTFKEYYKNLPFEAYDMLFRVLSTDEETSRLIELVCTNTDYVTEQDLIKFLTGVLYITTPGFLKTALTIMKVAPKNLQNHEEFVEKILSINAAALQYAEELRTNKTFLMRIMKANGKSLEHAPEEFKNDREVVRIALMDYPQSFKYASAELQGDENFILEFTNTITDIFKNASETLRNKKEFVKKVLQKDGRAIQYISDNLKEDSELSLMALKKCPACLQLLPEKSLSDKKFVLDFLESWNGENHYSADFGDVHKIINKCLKHFNNDVDIVLAITQKAPSMLSEFIAEKLLNDDEFVLKLLNINHPEVILTAVSKKPSWLTKVSEDLINDKPFILKFVSTHKEALKYVLKQFKDDKEVVMKAVEADAEAIKYASARLKKKPEIIWSVLEKMGILDPYIKQISSTPTFFSESLKNQPPKVLSNAFLIFAQNEDAQKIMENIFDISFAEEFEGLKKHSAHKK